MTVISRDPLVFEQIRLYDKTKEWRNMAFFASLLVNPIETFKIAYLPAASDATLGHYTCLVYKTNNA